MLDLIILTNPEFLIDYIENLDKIKDISVRIQEESEKKVKELREVAKILKERELR